jgi:hypothetical protein
VSSLSVPAGSYLISAKVVVLFGDSGSQNLCTLSLNGGLPVDSSQANSNGAVPSATLKLLAVANLAGNSNSIVVNCSTTQGLGGAQNQVLTALKVGNVF